MCVRACVRIGGQDGKVCISILHEAKEDQFNQQEQMSEKWRPILGVSKTPLLFF